MSQPIFAKTPPVFFQRLREVTDSYFNENNLRRTGDGRLDWKTGILLTALVGLYILLVFFTPSSTFLALSLCAVLGMVVASVGFNVMHDGAHGSYSQRKWVNDMMGHSLNLLGGSV
ncbi:MAG: acyl-CoA desaturase, partial [Flavobacteriales bacterium]